ncbi:hypothetical protein [Paludifilum halophilum]|uniref:Uncharacterized protein n=1 Tax=Paludifilum halophilum TaxID=1642702 RepID=A0A235B6F3_9BACL|nr:hypothetical protein [Paludifilum halophilum]OYD07467.1 hypothetical protein CHM34_11235 [Paludifilum halophilum]
MWKKQERYYERYQVEDVLTFISRQLVQAKTIEGNEVYIQEIDIHEPLPPGAREILLNMDLPHVAPVLDVEVSENRATLIHPPFSGDPLPLVVNEKSPMKPAEALHTFTNLLKTMESLEQLPLPMSTTLDPRNISISSKPYLLFCWIKKYSINPPEEKWRELFIYLLTGIVPKNRTERVRFLENKNIPPAYRNLALKCFDPDTNRSEILHQAKQLKFFTPKKLKQKSLMKRLLRYAIVFLVSLLIGGLIGYTANVWIQDTNLHQHSDESSDG